MCMFGNAQKQAAKKFVEYWTFRRGSEKGEDQQFWNSLLRDVLGLSDVKRCIQYARRERDLSDKKDGSDRDKETAAEPLKSLPSLPSLGGSSNG